MCLFLLFGSRERLLRKTSRKVVSPAKEAKVGSASLASEAGQHTPLQASLSSTWWTESLSYHAATDNHTRAMILVLERKSKPAVQVQPVKQGGIKHCKPAFYFLLSGMKAGHAMQQLMIIRGRQNRHRKRSPQQQRKASQQSRA